jgi:hypothetical protein
MKVKRLEQVDGVWTLTLQMDNGQEAVFTHRSRRKVLREAHRFAADIWAIEHA